MNTNVHITLSDDERARVGAAVYGKPTPVTRKQVNEIVEILFAQLKEVRDDVQPTQPGMGQPLPPTLYDDVPARGASSARPARPNDPDYMRGWNAVGRAIQEGRLKR